jgi:hypothetical protein
MELTCSAANCATARVASSEGAWLSMQPSPPAEKSQPSSAPLKVWGLKLRISQSKISGSLILEIRSSSRGELLMFKGSRLKVEESCGA